MSETYMVMVLVPIMAPFTCIGAGETRATQIWARVTTLAAVGNCKRQIRLQSVSARSVPEGSDGGPAARAGPHPPVSRRQTAGDRDQSGRPKVGGKPAPETRSERVVGAVAPAAVWPPPGNVLTAGTRLAPQVGGARSAGAAVPRAARVSSGHDQARREIGRAS